VDRRDAVLLVEGAKGTHALSRSFHLVKPRWWPNIGLALLVALLTEVLRFSAGLLLIGLLLVTRDTTSTPYIVLAGVISAIASLLTTPLVAAAYVILYFDLRVRSEGLDIQLVLANLESEATPNPSTPQWGAGSPPATWGQQPGQQQWGQHAWDRPPPPAPPGVPPMPPPPAPPSAPAASRAAATGSDASTGNRPVIATTASPEQLRREANGILSSRRYTGAPVPRPLHSVLRWIGDRFSTITHWIGDRFSWLPGPATCGSEQSESSQPVQ